MIKLRKSDLPAVVRLSPKRRKQIFAVKENAHRFIKNHGINNVGFLTLTFPDEVLDWKEGSKRFNYLNKRVLPDTFGHWIRIFDRTKSGHVHYHLLVDCKKDIRTGFDFSLYTMALELKKKKKGYKKIEKKAFESANENLKNLWKILREKLPKYHFGRHELLPIRTTDEAVASYVTKFIANAPYTGRDKGVRRITYSQKQLKSNPEFSWNTQKGKEWRRKLKLFCEILGFKNQEEISKKYGKIWAYVLSDAIMDIDNIQEKIKTGEYIPVDGNLIHRETGEELLGKNIKETKIQEKQEKFYKIWKNQNIMKNQKDIDQRGILL